MNRRQAIQQLAIMGTGLALYPACNMEKVPEYVRVPLDRKRYRLFRQISEGILPADHSLYLTREPRSEYILTILNDCTSSIEIDQFLKGLTSFQDYLDENGIKSLENLNNEELDELFDYLENSKSSDDNLFQFYRTTKNLARQHFTTSEKFMTEEMDYEFVPARYIGCADI